MKFSRLMIAVLTAVIPLTSCKKKEQPYFNELTRKGTAETPVKEVPKDILATQQAFINVAKQVNPTVVNISTVSKKSSFSPSSNSLPFSRTSSGSAVPVPGTNVKPASARASSSARTASFSPMITW